MFLSPLLCQRFSKQDERATPLNGSSQGRFYLHEADQRFSKQAELAPPLHGRSQGRIHHYEVDMNSVDSEAAYVSKSKKKWRLR